MKRPEGWKPLPVLLKIVWIFTAIGAMMAFLSIFSVAEAGSEILGFKISGVKASIVEFFLSLLIPVILLIAMLRRNLGTWILGAFFYLFSAVNLLFMFTDLENKVDEFKAANEENLRSLGMAVTEVDRHFYWLMLVCIVVAVTLTSLTFAVFFFVKRKYFYPPEPANEESSSADQH